MKVTGRIVKGRREYDDPSALAIALREIPEGERFEEETLRWRPRRTDRANRRYWGVIVPLAIHFLSQTRDLPLSKEQAHYVLVAAFLGCEETPLGLVPMKTSLLDTKQFAAYCEKVEAWLAENGYAIPEQHEATA